MILRFSSGSVTPASASRKRFSRVDDVQVDAGRGHEVALDLLGLALAQQPVVDEDAGEPVADRALHDGRGDRGVDAAGEAADRPAVVADLLADPLDLLLDDVDHRPGRAAAGDVVAGSARAPAGRARCAAPRGATGRRPGRASTSSNAATGVDVGGGEHRRSPRGPR